MSFIINSFVHSGAFAPDDIAGLVGWWDADNVSGGDGDPVSTWPDASSSAWDLTQASTARPTIQTNELNTHSVVRFDGTNDSMVNTSVSVAQPNTVFLVAKRTTSAAQDAFFDGSTTRQAFYTESTTNLKFFAGSDIDTGDAPGTAWRYYSVVVNGASSEIWMDGVSVWSGNPGANTLAGLLVGVDGGAGTYFLDGDIAELIMYDSALGTSDRENVEDYLKSKYGL